MEKSSLLSALADNTLVNIVERNRCIAENIEYPHEEMIHKNLQKLETGIKELDRELSIAEESGTLSSKNLKEKEDSLIKLKNQYENLETLIQDKNDNLISKRNLLFERNNNKPQTSTSSLTSSNNNNNNNKPKSKSKTVRFSDQTIVNTDDLDNSQVLQLQERIITDQDQNLDRLDAAIGRQRELGLRIGEELDYHIELLADTEDMVDNTDGTLNRAKRSLVKFSEESKKKGSTCAVIDQDQNLDRLDAAIGRQRELGLRIGEELDYHIELLADTEDMVDNTDGTLNRAKRSLVKFSEESKKKGSTCAVIGLMLILFLILIIALS
ncbi:hypothetical protein Glove_709g63 [Diversispora epigaea]|uniref:t-SNARE coiled-coil homology domain-containing protein n=1 Tax=Diversispora epigaea TaxID=1348612 RepID=A0A397G3Z9_9GLOM|nr:hypothetical protein Glove_709g63 [Diversispora epigaea]